MIPTAAAQAIDVLLVEDHRSVLWGLAKLIDGESPRMRVVGSCTCSREALAAVQKHKPDVVLLDLDLGEESGVTLVPRLRAICGAKVLVLTGMKAGELREKAVMEGACGLVLKSEPAETILKAIERVHNGELWLDRETTARVFQSFAQRAQNSGLCDPGALTPTERRVIASVVKFKGVPNKVIADALHISSHTLRNHLASIYSKLGIHHRLDLVLYAMERGLDHDAA